jgi:hypothetical protein
MSATRSNLKDMSASSDIEKQCRDIESEMDEVGGVEWSGVSSIGARGALPNRSGRQERHHSVLTHRWELLGRILTFSQDLVQFSDSWVFELGRKVIATSHWVVVLGNFRSKLRGLSSRLLGISSVDLSPSGSTHTEMTCSDYLGRLTR